MAAQGKGMPMLSTIRARLTISHLLVIVLAVGLSGLLLLSSLERYFLRAMEDSLIAQARITAQALIPGATTIGPAVEAQAPAYNRMNQQQVENISVQVENFYPPTETLTLSNLDLTYLADASFQLSTQLDTRIRVLDAQGIVLVDSLRREQGADLRADPLVAQALTGQYASSTDRSWLARDAAMHVALPVLFEGRLAGVVYLSQPLRDVTAVVRDLRTMWWLPTAVALLAAGVLGLLLSRAITRPLRQLTAAAGAVAEGQLDQQVPATSRDELGHLSRAFNQMTARLQAARQVQTDFVADVSHELRTPLTSIKGTVETLRDGAVDDPEVRDRFLETVEGETDRLIRLVNDLLLLSRADSEALNLQCQPLDLAQLVQEVVERLALPAEAREIALQLKLGPGEHVAWADPDRLEQVLVNLLDNAIKYSRPGGTVTVRVDGEQDSAALPSARPSVPPFGKVSTSSTRQLRTDRVVRIQVCDEGIGIPADDLERIGQRFYRADRARSRAEGGSGLGLSIAQALVEAHGGELWLESVEGEGTVVSFTLPAVTRDEAPSC